MTLCMPIFPIITLLVLRLCISMTTFPPPSAAMRVIATDDPTLTSQTIPRPNRAPNHVLIQIHAFGINPVDVQKRKAVKKHTVLGFEGSGVVAALGSGVSTLGIGDEVYFLGSGAVGGAYGEYVTVDARLCAPKPSNLKHSEAACIPLCYLTAYEGIVSKLRLGSEYDVLGRPRRLLIIGGAGGVGSFAIMIAKCLPNIVITATASSSASEAHCLAIGAHRVIHHESIKAPKPFTEGGDSGSKSNNNGPLSDEYIPDNSFDAVLCCAPLTNMEAIARVVAPFGRICGIVGGKPLSNLDVGLLMFKSIALEFVVVFGTLRFGDLPQSAVSADAVAAQGRILSGAAEFLEKGGCDVRDLLKAGGVVEFTPEAIDKVHEKIGGGHSSGRWVGKIRE